jgi:hypothetical protein
MTTISIRGIPDRAHRELLRRAKARRHSLSREIILCLTRACDAGRFRPEDWLARAEQLRKRLHFVGFMDTQLRAARRRGRP